MGESIPIVRQHAHIKRERVDGLTKFRWYCSCVRANTFPAQPRAGQWHRQILTVVESFRQHWESVHKGHELPDWDFMMNRAVVWAVGDIAEDDAAGFWVAPPGKRPAVAADYRTTNYFVQADKAAEAFSAMDYFMGPELEEEKKGMSRLSDIEARLRELEKEAARYARFPKTDEWPVGTVIVYDQESPTGELYTYGVLKCANDSWYWTGHGVFTKSGANYDHLIEHLAHDRTSNIRVATPDVFKALFAEDEDLVSAEEIDASLKGSASERKV